MSLSPDERIRRLEEDLYEARCAVVSLLPEPIQAIAESYHKCKSRSEADQWKERLVEGVIARAEILSPQDGSRWGPRAYCPLCGHGSSGPYDRGFAVPDGLERHLMGRYNSVGCLPLSPVLGMARDYWRPIFAKTEAELERPVAAKKKAKKAPKKTAKVPEK
jgi:hypothetical protein